MDVEDSTDLTTVESYDKSSLASPCLVTFEYGSLAKLEASKLHCSMFVDKNNSNKQNLMVSKGNQCYKGKLNSKPLCQTLLLIRNKKTNKARVISAFSCILESSLKERNQQKTATYSDSDTNIRITNLSKTFGSKKAKRMSDLSLRMSMINKYGLQEDARKSIAEMNVKAKDVNDIKTSGDDTMIQVLPPCNREATRVEDIYKVEDILNEIDLSLLEKSVSLLNDENEKKSEFLQKHCNQLGPNATDYKLKLLIYADSLLRFVNMGAIEIKNKNCVRNICPTNRAISTKILNEYTVLTGNTRNRPVSYKDKAVCCMMILVLLACNFKMNLDLISSLMKGYHQKKLLQLCKLVGVVSTTEGGQKFYVLKVPLPKLPTIRMKKKP